MAAQLCKQCLYSLGEICGQPLSPAIVTICNGSWHWVPWLGRSCSVEPWCRRAWAAAGEAAGALLAPTLGFLPPLSWLQGSVCSCCSRARSAQRCAGKGKLCLLQPLPGVAAWEAVGSGFALVCWECSLLGTDEHCRA